VSPARRLNGSFFSTDATLLVIRLTLRALGQFLRRVFQVSKVAIFADGELLLAREYLFTPRTVMVVNPQAKQHKQRQAKI
jgi:hypothetical protein